MLADHLSPGPEGIATDVHTNLEFWYGLVNERNAARFLALSDRRLQGLRYEGGGPRFVRLSGRCVRYRRADLLKWAQGRPV